MMRIMQAGEFRPEDFKTPPIQAGNDIEEKVDAILRRVRECGDSALKEYTEKYDGVKLESVLVSEQEIEERAARIWKKFTRKVGWDKEEEKEK